VSSRPPVVVFDYGSGNIRSVVRALATAGCEVSVTADPDQAMAAAGLVVPGVGAFAACRAALRAAGGDDLIIERLARGSAVLGICVGMQVLFEGSDEHAEQSAPQDTVGLAVLPGRVVRLTAPVVPHMGWNTVSAAPGSRLLSPDPAQRYYFVHSYAVPAPVAPADGLTHLTTADYGGQFIAAVERGPCAGTQFHPEKSGPAGVDLLARWRETL